MTPLRLLLLAALLLAPSLPANATGEPPQNQVRQSVESFYRAYIGELKSFQEKPNLKRPNVIKWTPFMTPEFAAAYLRAFRRTGYEFDPILQSRHIPDAMAVQTVRFEGDTAFVQARYIGSPEDTPPLELRLKLQRHKWLLDAAGALNN